MHTFYGLANTRSLQRSFLHPSITQLLWAAFSLIQTRLAFPDPIVSPSSHAPQPRCAFRQRATDGILSAQDDKQTHVIKEKSNPSSPTLPLRAFWHIHSPLPPMATRRPWSVLKPKTKESVPSVPPYRQSLLVVATDNNRSTQTTYSILFLWTLSACRELLVPHPPPIQLQPRFKGALTSARLWPRTHSRVLCSFCPPPTPPFPSIQFPPTPGRQDSSTESIPSSNAQTHPLSSSSLSASPPYAKLKKSPRIRRTPPSKPTIPPSAAFDAASSQPSFSCYQFDD
ncbi:hypothetical protein FA13DRAFT_1803820 [Coprinellus micaceus]|uniref:Uncharacterized protein n=1 Tax=Coprinellus micaceus TaxID=71717 RepID=A0A4Y7SAB2_COPMI|nr:hypothetical protein FA13DRAFT_1803820 [Coprinellus micaceus]